MTGIVSTGVGVLDKVMSILSLFDDRTQVLEPAAVARSAGMTTPTAYRLMKAMTAHGLLAPSGRGYALGPALLRLGQLATLGMDVVGVARPHMVALRDEVNESVELQVLVGHSRVPVHMEASTRTVRSATQIGQPLPLHKGASGRPIIAWHGHALDLARRSAEAAGDPLDEAAYAARLEQIRTRGYDVGGGERDPETAAASAPVVDRSGDVAAILVVSGTKTRFEDAAHRQAAIDGVLRTARQITSDLGGAFPV